MINLLLSKLSEQVNYYRDRKNEYKRAYIEAQEKIQSLEQDLVDYDELTSKQQKIIRELEDMCLTYSKHVNDEDPTCECEGCSCCDEETSEEEDNNVICELYDEVDRIDDELQDGMIEVHGRIDDAFNEIEILRREFEGLFDQMDSLKTKVKKGK